MNRPPGVSEDTRYQLSAHRPVCRPCSWDADPLRRETPMGRRIADSPRIGAQNPEGAQQVGSASSCWLAAGRRCSPCVGVADRAVDLYRGACGDSTAICKRRRRHILCIGQDHADSATSTLSLGIASCSSTGLVPCYRDLPCLPACESNTPDYLISSQGSQAQRHCIPSQT